MKNSLWEGVYDNGVTRHWKGTAFTCWRGIALRDRKAARQLRAFNSKLMTLSLHTPALLSLLLTMPFLLHFAWCKPSTSANKIRRCHGNGVVRRSIVVEALILRPAGQAVVVTSQVPSRPLQCSDQYSEKCDLLGVCDKFGNLSAHDRIVSSPIMLRLFSTITSSKKTNWWSVIFSAHVISCEKL